MFSGYGQGWLTSLSTGRTRDLGCHPGLSPLPHTARSAPRRALVDALISDERVQLPLPSDCKRFCWKSLLGAGGIAEAEDLPSVPVPLQSRKALKVQEWGEDWQTLPLPALAPSDGGAHRARHIPPTSHPTARGNHLQPGLCQ